MMVGNYLSSGYNLKPLLRVILRHPAMYQELDAPDLVKRPDRLRRLDACG